MRILHIAPNAPYNENWGYQENLLPKYQAKLGHEVMLIITNTSHKDGKNVEVGCVDYVQENGIRLVRLNRKIYRIKPVTVLKSKMEVFPYLTDFRPDLVFFHGLVSDTIFDVIKYKKKVNPECVIVQDNHMDGNNNHQKNRFKMLVFQGYNRLRNLCSSRYVSRIYGVTPWRKTYAEEYFGISNKKTDVLIMGADDEKIDFQNREQIRTEIRGKYNVKDSDFLVVSGGKIDRAKKIDVLMQACMQVENVKLLVFGKVEKDIESEFYEKLKNSKNLIYTGWVDADRVYDYFFAADLVVFPGGHSVLWEQACASKVPCLFRQWVGMEHVNNGGNSDFIDDVSAESLQSKIQDLMFTKRYCEMKKVAMSSATDIYRYSNIAKKSLECWYGK